MGVQIDTASRVVIANMPVLGLNLIKRLISVLSNLNCTTTSLKKTLADRNYFFHLSLSYANYGSINEKSMSAAPSLMMAVHKHSHLFSVLRTLMLYVMSAGGL